MTMITYGLSLLLNIGAPQPVCAVAAELRADIERLTDYRVAENCPAVLRRNLTARFGGEAQAAEYLPETGEIVLSPELDLNTAIGRGYLLHEMVHAAQFAAGRQDEIPCPGRLEAEAYMVQSAYLRDQDEDTEANLMLLMSEFAGHCSDRFYGAD